MSDSGGGQNRLPLVIGSGAVVVIAIVAIAFGVNSASAPLAPVPSATPTAVVPTPTASPSPTAAATIPFADCATTKFCPVLAPLDQPASVHTYAAEPKMTIDTTKLYQATIVTSKGNIVLCLQPNLAPNTVNVMVTPEMPVSLLSRLPLLLASTYTEPARLPGNISRLAKPFLLIWSWNPAGSF